MKSSGSSAPSSSEDGKLGSSESLTSVSKVFEDMLQRAMLPLVQKIVELESKFEAKSLLSVPAFQSSLDDQPRGGGGNADSFESPPEFNSRRFEHRPNRQSLGSFRSEDSQDVVVRKSSFRLDKPKFEYPLDTKNDGAFDDAVIKFLDECDHHIELWCNLPENKHKAFEGSEVFSIVSLPPGVQKRVSHNLEMIYEKSEISGWTVEQVQRAKTWSKATSAEVKKLILSRRAKGVARSEAVKTIQPPAISWAKDAGFIHLDAFEEYKSKMTTQVSRLHEGGVSLSFIAIKDAIISAIPDREYRIELYTQFGHSGSLPGPNASGEYEEFSMKSIFDVIRAHIEVIKQKGLARTINRNSVSFSFPTPPTSRKFGNHGPPSRFPSRAVQAIELDQGFPESDRTFWSRAHAEAEVSADDSDEFHQDQVNAMIQQVKSKECHHKGIGPDGKVLCPYLGNPDTAKCGFIHPAKELELKGKGVSKSTPAQPKKVHQVSGGLEIPYAANFDAETDVEGSDF